VFSRAACRKSSLALAVAAEVDPLVHLSLPVALLQRNSPEILTGATLNPAQSCGIQAADYGGDSWWIWDFRTREKTVIERQPFAARPGVHSAEE